MRNLIHISPQIKPAVAAGAALHAKAPLPLKVGCAYLEGWHPGQHPQERRRRGRTRLSWSRLRLLAQVSHCGEGTDRSALCGESQTHVTYRSKRQSRYQARPAAPPHEKRPRSVDTVPRPHSSAQLVIPVTGYGCNVYPTVGRSRSQNDRKKSSLCRPLTTRPLVFQGLAVQRTGC